MESHSQIEERAAAWLAKRDCGEWSPADDSELAGWLAASTANKVAFIRLDGAWNDARRLKALGGGGEVGVVPPPGQWHRSPLSREAESAGLVGRTQRPRRLLSRAIAASVVVAAAAGFVWFLASRAPTYETLVGGTESVPMQDGSKVTLNTDTSVRVDVTDKVRQVRLEHGEAFFEVARDPSRPFIVTAGKKRVIAVGTQFSVRRVGNDVRVFVTEGKVRIEDDASSVLALPRVKTEVSGEGPSMPPGEAPGTKSATGRQSGQVMVAAGGIARTADDAILVQENALPEVEDYLSWRSGYLIFHDTALVEAIAEFNRYNERKMVIVDPEVAAIRINGKFRSTHFEAFVRLLEDGFPIRAQSSQGRILLEDRRR